jgi:raffinose/stachyose/melibiose transport system substrate-binding protein
VHANRSPRVLAVAAAAGAALLLTSCAGGSINGGGGESGGEDDAAWNDATADLSGVTITFGGGTAGGPLDGAIAAFEEETGATVERTTYPDPYEQNLQTRVATGDVPDLASWQPTTSMLTSLQAPNNLLPLDDAPWLDSLDPAVRDIAGFVDDTRYAAITSSPSVMGVYYNKALFEKYGVTEMPQSWDEMVEVAQTIAAGGDTAFIEAGGAQWPTQWAVQMQLAEAAQDGLWEDVNTHTTTFADPPIIDAITEYQTLVADGLFNDDLKTALFEDQAADLFDGEGAMVLQVNALLEQLLTQHDAQEIDDALGWFPISGEGTVATTIPDNKNGIVVFKTGDAEREAAAKQFLTFLMTDYYPTFIEDGGLVSIEPDVENPDTVPQLAQDIAASLESSVGSMQSLAIANPDLYINLASLLYGEMTPEQVADATQQQFGQLAQAQGAEGF